MAFCISNLQHISFELNMAPEMQSEKKNPSNNVKTKDRSEEEEIEEIQVSSKKTVYDKVYELAEKFASTRLGQYVAEKGDRVLKVVEDTAKWGLPQSNSEVKLERPLPWLPFLSLMLTLRLTMVWLSVLAIMIGNGPVTPHDVVYFLQTRRRKLRSLRVHGAKAKAVSYRCSQTNDKSFMGKLSKVMSRAICRPGQNNADSKRVFMEKGRISEESLTNDRQASKRPRDDSNTDLNLTVDQMLSKYANENSEDDSDFIPNPEEENKDSSSSCDSSLCSQTGDEMNEENPSEAELNKSFEFREGKEPVNMPKPFHVVKAEPISESDDLGTPKEKNQKPMTNGVGKSHSEAAHKLMGTGSGFGSMAPQNNKNSKMPVSNGHHDKHKISPARESTEGTHKSVTMNPTAAAGSPTDFNKCFQPKAKSNNPNEMQSHSTPTNTEDNSETQTKPPPSNNYKQNFYHNNKYRGRNRRHF